jgi:hypothetical protein
VTHLVGFGLALALFTGIAWVGQRYGARAERTLDRAVWVIVGAFVGLVVVGLIWSTIS